MKLAKTLHISHAERLRDELESLLDSDANIRLDISDVETVDTASLQILCALKTSLLASKGEIEWLGTSPALLAAAQRLGVQEFLDLRQND